ncbi:seryl-tRNA synthetase, mitochondrial [Tachypleus tridentatus]|uniref:seryl-tRNA synthetase, mitochondrial n=1 Tax=Tachypleus tridentatus TaxID=6853 RepID=UPI003FD4D0DF
MNVFLKRYILHFCHLPKCLQSSNIVPHCLRNYSTSSIDDKFYLAPPELDLQYLCNPENTKDIEHGIKCRKAAGNIREVMAIKRRLDAKNKEETDWTLLQKKLVSEAAKLPNRTHPKVLKNTSDQPVEVETVGSAPIFHFKPKQFHKLAQKLDMLRMENLGLVTGHRSYYLKKELAQLEQALLYFSVERLLSKGFTLVSVPDILHPSAIEACGMDTKGKRNQVYHLEPTFGWDLCLSGTAEMALGAFFANKILSLNDLPQKLAAMSRCFRAETSTVQEEKGIFRVHQFTKVEMFGVTANETCIESEQLLDEFTTIQRSLFQEIGLHFRLLDMPASDLGAPAYRKFDIEAWMPGRGIYGEVSSASNCTDYQSRRLHIKYETQSTDGTTVLKHVHTVNGTACAIPRMLIAIFENFQTKDGDIRVPDPLVPYMKGLALIKNHRTKDKIYWTNLKSV